MRLRRRFVHWEISSKFNPGLSASRRRACCGQAARGHTGSKARDQTCNHAARSGQGLDCLTKATRKNYPVVLEHPAAVLMSGSCGLRP